MDLLGQRAEADGPVPRLTDGRYQVLEGAAETVEAPDDERVPEPGVGEGFLMKGRSLFVPLAVSVKTYPISTSALAWIIHGRRGNGGAAVASPGAEDPGLHPQTRLKPAAARLDRRRDPNTAPAFQPPSGGLSGSARGLQPRARPRRRPASAPGAAGTAPPSPRGTRESSRLGRSPTVFCQPRPVPSGSPIERPDRAGEDPRNRCRLRGQQRTSAATAGRPACARLPEPDPARSGGLRQNGKKRWST